MGEVVEKRVDVVMSESFGQVNSRASETTISANLVKWIEKWMNG